MPRWSFALLPIASLLHAEPAASPGGQAPPFAHLQTDRPAYRLGEAVWFRVHGPDAGRLDVRLLDPTGTEVDRWTPESDGDVPGSAFVIPRHLPGGVFRLEAHADDSIAHVVPVEVVELALPRARLELAVLGDLHLPGKPIAAAFRARDLRGRPIRGARVEYRATLGGTAIRDTAGRTDTDGRAMVRFVLPEAVEEGGHLAVGITFPEGEAAIAKRIDVAAPVASIDAFAEGGSILEGWPQRVALFVRGGDGEPTSAEGRIIDDTGAAAAAFRTDASGLATVSVPYEEGRTYRAVVDRPAGTREAFPLPAPSGHDHAIAVTDAGETFEVVVATRRGAATGRLDLALEAGGRIVARVGVNPQWRPRQAIGSARVAVARTGAQGIGHLVLLAGERAILKRPVFLGARAPVAVTLQPKSKGPYLPGRPIELEICARQGQNPVSADLSVSIFQGSAAGIEDLATRLLLESSLSTGARIPPRVLEEPGRRDAFLLVHDAYAYAATGAALENGGLPAAKTGRVLVAKIAPTQRAQPRLLARTGKPGTAVRSQPLELALEAAPYTVLLEKEEKAHEIRLDVPPAALVAPPAAGSALTLPQKLTLPASTADTRRTLFWEGRVRTGPTGRAVINIRLNHMVSDLAWIAQGFAGAHPASGRGTLSPDASFETKFRAPAHLLAGDTFDLMLDVTDRDPRAGIIEIEVFPPACLKPLLRTRLSFDPRKDARLQRFRFEAVQPAEEADLRVVARRGLYEEVHARTLCVERRGIELVHGEAGFERGLRELSFRLPAEAAGGSVQLYASVLPSPLAEATEISRGMLRQPTGCFEQFTSANYANLVLLDALLEKGEEPKALDQAYRLAEAGFQRLLQHRDPDTGGFCMFPGRAPEVVATTVALPQLVLYERIARGRGRPELETAIRWLERAPLAEREEIYLTFVLHEAGWPWKRSARVAALAPSSTYEQALQAASIACWPGERPKGSGARLETFLDEIESKTGFFDPGAESGEGILGSRGGFLESEVLALAIIALDAAGRHDRAELLARDLRSRGFGSLGTQGGALATRALARVSPAATGSPFKAQFDPGAGAARRTLVSLRSEPLVFEETVPLGPGDSGRVALEIRSEAPCAYRLAYTYRTEVLHSSPEAPFGLGVSLPGAADLNSELPITVVIEPRRAMPSSQVIARIGLPGGIEVLDEELRARAAEAKVAHWEIRDGFLDLYWSGPPSRPIRLMVPTRAVVSGSFKGQPSVLAPYYEAGREQYAPSLALRVHNPFGIEAPFDGSARPRRR